MVHEVSVSVVRVGRGGARAGEGADCCCWLCRYCSQLLTFIYQTLGIVSRSGGCLGGQAARSAADLVVIKALKSFDRLTPSTRQRIEEALQQRVEEVEGVDPMPPIGRPAPPKEKRVASSKVAPEGEGGSFPLEGGSLLQEGGSLSQGVGSLPQGRSLFKHVWVLDAPSLKSDTLTINGVTPTLAADGSVPELPPDCTRGSVRVPAGGATFIRIST